ncbi:uncharacterized protein LOC135812163 isoform X2 [Sycon ciliatum]|uniref:uncharacterized protein LOC135812163 isoform X2 n=1 Tax=Sycon ciliatum TaxID=27933 RepID=UPI0031F71A82
MGQAEGSLSGPTPAVEMHPARHMTEVSFASVGSYSCSDSDDYAIIDLCDGDVFLEFGRQPIADPPLNTVDTLPRSALQDLLKRTEVCLDLQDLRRMRERLSSIASRNQQTGDQCASDAAMRLEGANLQRSMTKLLRACVTNRVVDGEQAVRACDCCSQHSVLVNVALPSGTKSATFIGLCSKCYMKAGMEEPLTGGDMLMMVDFLMQLFGEKNSDAAQSEDGECEQSRASSDSGTSKLLSNKVTRMAGKIEAHLSHDAAKKTLSMALLRVYLNSYTNLFRGTLQVQACLLRDGSRSEEIRLSKPEEIRSSGKIKWTQLLEWSGIDSEELPCLKLEMSVWRNKPMCLVGVAEVALQTISSAGTSSPGHYSIYYQPTTPDSDQVSCVAPELIETRSQPECQAAKKGQGTSFLSRLKMFFDADMFTSDTGDADIPEEDVLTASTILNRIAEQERMEHIISKGENADDDDDYHFENIIPTVTFDHVDGESSPHDTCPGNENPAETALGHGDQGLLRPDSNSPVSGYDAVAPIRRRSISSAPKTNSTVGSDTYFVYPILAPRHFSSTSDVSLERGHRHSSWDLTMQQHSLAQSSGEHSARSSTGTPTPVADGRAATTSVQSTSARHQLPAGKSRSSNCLRRHVQASFEGDSPSEPDEIMTLRRPVPVESAEAISNEIELRRRQVEDRLEKRNTLDRLVQVSHKLATEMADSAEAGGMDVTPHCDQSDDADTHEISTAPERCIAEPEQKGRHISFAEVHTEQMAPCRDSNMPPTELRLSWTDDGRHVTIYVEEARNVCFSSIGKTLPSGLYCKAHLRTKEGRKLKAKKTSTVRFTPHPHFNERLVFDATARGGDMKMMLWASSGALGRHQLLCSTALTTSSQASPTDTSKDCGEGDTPPPEASAPVERPSSPKSPMDRHWYALRPETTSLPRQRRIGDSPIKLPSVLHRFSHKRSKARGHFADRRLSVSTGNLEEKSANS